MLEQWLPNDEKINKARKQGKEGVIGGLNIACPLDQGEKSRVWVDVSESEDPLVRDYLEEMRKKSGVKGVKKEEDSPALRRKEYANMAREYNAKRDTDIHVPQWVVFGALAAAVVGFVLLNSKGGLQPKGRWK
jgi:hypothetical protein